MPTLKELHDLEQNEARDMARLDALIEKWARDEARDKRLMWISGVGFFTVVGFLLWSLLK